MKAIKKNLTDAIYEPMTSDRIIYCNKCGAEFSANRGDYWDVPEGRKFKHCGKVMDIATKRTVFTIVPKGEYKISKKEVAKIHKLKRVL